MGFYWQWFSEFFRSTGSLTRKEKRRINRAEAQGGRAQVLFAVKFPLEIEERHTITKFIADFKKFTEYVEKGDHNSYLVIFYELAKDIGEFKDVHEALVALKELWDGLPEESKGVEREILSHFIILLGGQDIQLRNQYTEVEAIVNEAKKLDHQQLMDALRTRFKKKVKMKNLLERYVWKRSANATRNDILITRDNSRRIRGEVKRIHASVHRGDNVVNFDSVKRVKKSTAEIAQALADFGQKSYLVRERAILMVIKILYLCEQAKDFLRNEAEKNFIPKKTAIEGTETLNRGAEKISKDFHDVVSQEFRIAIHDVEGDIQLSKELKKAA